MDVPAIPAGYHSVTPYLVVNGAAAAIDFYQRAFGAEVLLRLKGPGDSVMHAELMIGNSPVMLTDANPEWGMQGPDALGGTCVSLAIYLEDVDAAFLRALEAGGELVREVSDQFYGDRSGQLCDPFGHLWTLGTHKEDLDEAELQRRMDAMFADNK